MKVFSLFTTFGVMAISIAGCHSDQPAARQVTETVQAHLVESVQQDSASLENATGTLHAKENATLSAQVMGSVRQVLVHEGDVVRAGQTLLVLDDASSRAALAQAQASVLVAEQQQQAAQSEAALGQSTLARYRQLQLQRSVSPQEMDEVARRAEGASARVSAMQAQVEATKAQVAGARATLGYTRIRAPFAGVITARMVDPGAMAAPGLPLLQMEGAGPLQMQVSVDESSIAKVQRGMKIAVHVDGAPEAASTGIVREILPAADPASHSFTVKIDLPASKLLKAGMYGSAAIETGRHAAVLVPASACVQRGSLQYVYALDGNNAAQLRAVTLGAHHGAMVEVLSGLSPHERLVDAPGDRDLSGKRIEVR